MHEKLIQPSSAFAENFCDIQNILTTLPKFDCYGNETLYLRNSIYALTE